MKWFLFLIIYFVFALGMTILRYFFERSPKVDSILGPFRKYLLGGILFPVGYALEMFNFRFWWYGVIALLWWLAFCIVFGIFFPNVTPVPFGLYEPWDNALSNSLLIGVLTLIIGTIGLVYFSKITRLWYTH